MEYRLLVDLETIELLQRLAKSRRDVLLRHLAKIRSFPSNYSDYHERDSIGRRIEISIVSGWALHYWIDSADRHVKVLALERADR